MFDVVAKGKGATVLLPTVQTRRADATGIDYVGNVPPETLRTYSRVWERVQDRQKRTRAIWKRAIVLESVDVAIQRHLIAVNGGSSFRFTDYWDWYRVHTTVPNVEPDAFHEALSPKVKDCFHNACSRR